jgi:hypothetical protein
MLIPRGEHDENEHRGESGKTVVAQSGQEVERPSSAPKPPPTVGSPDRIRDVLQKGKTYEVTTALELVSPVRDKEWGLQKSVNLAYRAETRMLRTIEENDGSRVVELREILDAQAVKVVSQVEVRFVFTEPGSILLGGIVGLLDLTGAGGAATSLAASTIEYICEGYQAGIKQVVNEENTRVRAIANSLRGKKVRMTFIDGQGVVKVEPVDCQLTAEERDFLMASAVVSDAHLLPNVHSKPGDRWEVDGSAFSDFLPPSWHGVPRGSITIERQEDFEEGGNKYALLHCARGTLLVDATDQSRTRLARLTPRGKLKYNITKGHVESAELTALGSIEEASRDHLLFETRFEAQPEVQITYACTIVN